MVLAVEVARVLYLIALLIVALIVFALIQMSPLLMTVGLFAAWCAVLAAMFGSVRHEGDLR